MKKLTLLAGTALLSLPACSQSLARPSILPLRTLHLYETGVGYFERSGPLQRGELSALPLPAGHLDDALKTLVVLDPSGKAQVHGVEFDSSLSQGLARALGGLPAGEGTPLGHRDLLLALKGAAVEVHLAREGARLRGRLIEVPEEREDEPPAERKGKDEKRSGPAAPRGPALLLLTEAGEIRRLGPGEIRSVRPTEPAAAARLQASLGALTTRGAGAGRLLRVLGRAAGPVTLGYIAETPIWRASYRLVLPAAGGAAAGPASGSASGPAPATLQGWALLHNDGDEDWQRVSLRLVSGRPDSFLYPLGAPRYTRRTLVHPEAELSTVPQLLNTTVDAIWGDHEGEGGLGLTGTGSGGGGSGSGGIGLGSIGTVGHGAGVGAADSSLLSVGNLAAVAESKGVEAGALFSYAPSAPITLRAHGSATVPFLMEGVSAETITLVAAPGEPARSAVLFQNSTRQTLPEGPLSLFSSEAGAGGFAGETVLPRLKPGERRFLTHGADLDVELETERADYQEEVQRLTFERGALVEHYLKKGEVVYTVENRSGAPRRVFLQLPLHRNARVEGADALDYDAVAGKALAVFRAAARSRGARTLHTVEGLSRRTAPEALSSGRMKELSALPALSPAARQVAGEAEALLRRLSEGVEAQTRARAALAEAEQDLARHRESVKALTGASAGAGGDRGAVAAPFVRRMVEAEDRLTSLRERIGRLEGEAEERKKALTATLSRLPVRG